MKKLLLTLLLVTPIFASAQLSVPQGGTGKTSFPQNTWIYADNGGLQRLQGSTSPTVSWITATKTDATSTLQWTSISGAVSILGEYFTNFTNYVRSLFSEGDGIDIAAGQVAFDCTEVEGTGINCSTNDITLDATGDWTGTIDGNNFAGGAIGAGELLYGGSAGSLAELAAGTNGRILAMSGGIPAWVATTTFTTGLTYAAGNVTVNTSQNIATLSNLTTNGLVTTSGGNGTLGVTVNGTNGQVLAMSGGVPTWVASTTYGSGYATTTTNFLTHSTSTLAFNGLTVGQTIIPTAGALTFTPTITGTLTNAGLANSTISGIALGANLADLTATNATLTFSGTYNGGTARSIGLNLGNANTWTALQTFAHSSTTGQSSFIHASTTTFTLGGVTGSTWPSFCTSITGSADLCDGSDAAGAGASATSSNSDWIIYKKGASTIVYDTISNSEVLTTTSFSAACNYIVNAATSTFPARNKINVRAGYYNAVSDCIIDGNSVQYSPTFIFTFQASSTEIYVPSGVNAFRFQNQARVNITDLTCGIAGTGTCLFATTTSGTQSSLRESYVKGLNVHATTTSTGWGIDMINSFRNHIEGIDMRFVGNGIRERSNTSGFNSGDTTYERGFIEVLNAGIGYMVRMEVNAGTHNQNTFIDINGISNDTNDVMWSFQKSHWNRILSPNAEEFATTTEFYNSHDNNFSSTKYMNLGNSGGTVMYTDANSYNNQFECNYVEITSTVVLMRDLNTVATTRPNGFGNFSGGVCTIGDDGGSVTFATTTSSLILGVHDNLTGAQNYLNGIKVAGSKVHFGWNTGVTNFVEWLNSTIRFVVGGVESFSISSAGAIMSNVWNAGDATSFEIPNGTGNTISQIGQVAFDTTDNQLLIGTTTANTPVVLPTVQRIYSGTIASTSVDFISGGRIPLPIQRDGFIIKEIHCYVETGTSVVINLDVAAGGSNTDAVTCATTATADTAMSANYTIAASALMELELGTITGSVDYVSFSVWGVWTRE